MKYEIQGKPFPVLIVNLNGGEGIDCQNGAMIWMSQNMKMQTKAGGIGKVFTKALTGEAIFSNTYVAQEGPGMIALNGNTPGDIIPIELAGNEIICQKTAYLASTPGIELSMWTQKKISAGLVGGEGFILQKVSGKGTVFFEICGSVVQYTLAPGQTILVDTGYMAMMDSSCQMEVVKVGGIKNSLLGGEGFFNTKITGPGRVWLQTNRHLALPG